MKALIFGAGGVIGQHMMLCKPDDVQAAYYRSKQDPIFCGLDLTDFAAVKHCLDTHRPHVVLNLAGENRTDVVERDEAAFHKLNVTAPGYIGDWCAHNVAHYVHISSQAVFGGDNAPYGPDSACAPINWYGRQKLEAEIVLRHLAGDHCTIVRPTFVLGVRPMPAVGRENPVEQMMSGEHNRQVADRSFSISFAEDLARFLWNVTRSTPGGVLHHGGYCVTRHAIAREFSAHVEAAKHEDFAGLAPRPRDTSYNHCAPDAIYKLNLASQLQQFRDRSAMNARQRYRELAMFFRKNVDDCGKRLELGFHPLHAEVANDFRAANPQTDGELLEWYRDTDAYIWELSAYHADARFNYTGMTQGIGDRLRAAGARKVLCLGDGIGDQTLYFKQHGFDAVYHDLSGSRTAAFARARYFMYTGEEMETDCSGGWDPNLRGRYDAIVSCDFIEHVTDVPRWVEAIKNALLPGGLLFTQNAFACGSGPEGSIPMHLKRNDRYATEWDPLLGSFGFNQETSNWYRRAA